MKCIAPCSPIVVAMALGLILQAAELHADDLKKEPWLEYRLLSKTPLPGYMHVMTPKGETYYCAPTAFLNPIGFADVLPASNGNGVTIVLTIGATKHIREFTSEHVGDSIGIFVDGEFVRGPIGIAEPMAPRRISLTEEVGKDIRDNLVRVWSAPIDTGPGQHRLHVQGLGTIDADLHGGSPGDFQFLHEGSLYALPVSFASRPELNPKDKTVQEVVVREDWITAGDERFATVQEALRYIKNEAGPDTLLLVAISTVEPITWPKERMTELMPLLDYLHSNPRYVGFRQQMPEGWAWPTTSKHR